jgi:hypothetical protein
VSVLAGSVVGLAALGLLAAGGIATWATNTQRDAAGYLTTHTRSLSTASYAITSDGIDLGSAADVVTPGDVLGTVRVRATSIRPQDSVFIGVAPEAAAAAYLNGVPHAVVSNWAAGHIDEQAGVGSTRPAAAPADSRIWAAQASGPGAQTLTWRPIAGHWTVVVMNANGAAGVSVVADVGATVPDLGWIAAGLLGVGGLLLVVGVVLVVIPVTRASR